MNENQANEVFKLIDIKKLDNNQFYIIDYVNQYIGKHMDDYDPEVTGDYDLDERMAYFIKAHLLFEEVVTDTSYNSPEGIWNLKLTAKGIEVLDEYAGDLIAYNQYKLDEERENKKALKRETLRFILPLIISCLAIIISLVPLFNDEANSMKDEVEKLKEKKVILKHEVDLLNQRLLQIEQREIIKTNKKADSL